MDLRPFRQAKNPEEQFHKNYNTLDSRSEHQGSQVFGEQPLSPKGLVRLRQPRLRVSLALREWGSPLELNDKYILHLL